jgi:cytoskeletal protein CcmA (bactofilin family)
VSYPGNEQSAAVAYSSADDRGTSVIDAHSDVEGTYNTSRDLRIEGRLNGSINCDGVLFIADGAEVDASVEAESIIVSGVLRGTILCRGRLEITSSGSVTGEVTTAGLVIVEGARYEGQIQMMSASTEAPSAEAAPETREEPAPEAQDAYSLLRRYASSASDSAEDDTETGGKEDS